VRDLQGRLAFVTGSTGAIGKATAKLLRQRGARVVTHGTKPIDSPDHVFGDLTKEEVVLELFQKLRESHGSPDILVCCVGGNRRLHGHGSPDKDDCLGISMDEFWHQFHLNFTSAVYCCRAAVPNMMQNRWGRIVTVSSCLVGHPRPASITATYACAKAALEEYTLQLASQLRLHNIIANCVSPSSTKEIVPGETLFRYSSPEEVASVIEFLCGEGASYVSGQTLRVNGANIREQSWIGREIKV
jgi:3-oxoacyl-[acyl-carrier protein] reductase